MVTHQPDQTMNLHELSSLQRVSVRPGVMLRPLSADDASAILEILEADPSIRERVTVATRLHTRADVAQEVADNKVDGTILRFVIELHGKCVGLVTLWRDTGYFGDTANPHAYGFGYFLDPTVRGTGLVTDSVQALMSAAMKNLRVDSFMAFCEDSNPQSSAVLERLGFRRTDETYAEPLNGWTERRYEKRVASER